jgi:RimJ/RimL family protein N-acetyltransferase
MKATIIEETFFDCTCPHCGADASFPQSAAGLVQACPNCMEDLIAPEAEGSPARKLPLPLTTPRLLLRRLAAGDWAGVMECLPDEEKDEESTIRWLEQNAQVRLNTPNATLHLAIELAEGGRFIGYLGLRLTAPRQATVNFTVHPQYDQSDLPVEALNALLGFCFENIRLHRVTATLVSTDAAGIKLCEGVGMRREAVFLKDTEGADGSWLTSIWYAALEEDYLEAPPAGQQT